MQASVEELDGLKRCMTVQVPAETVDKEVQNRLVSLSRKARIDGFRPGKVPVKVVKRMFGPQVRQEVLGEVLQSSFQDAVQQQSLRVAGMPQVEPISLDEGSNLEYKATFEVFPEFQPAAIEGATIERPVVEIADSDVEEMLESLRRQRADWRAVEREAAEQDQVKITFEGRIGGEPFDNNHGEQVPVVIGSGSMIPGFEENLKGLKTGQQTRFDITFPETYPSADVAGKEATFEVTVDSVEEPVLPEVDDEFMAAFGVTEGGREALLKLLRENMQRELDDRLKGYVKRQVMDALLAANDISVPQALVNDEIENIAKEANLPAPPEGTDAQKLAEMKATVFGEDATRRVKLGLIVSRLINANDIEVDDGRLERQLETMAASYEDSDAFKRWYRQNNDAMASLRTLVLENQVVEWLLERATVTDKPMSFEAFMKPGSAPRDAAV